MQYSKLNVLHWHLSDSEWFSVKLEKSEEINQKKSDKLYSKDQLVELIQFAEMRGVRIIPEIDGPAHVLSMDKQLQIKDLVVCENLSCPAPPCGQLNLLNDSIYTPLSQIFKYIDSIFIDSYFHIGVDEVADCYGGGQDLKKLLNNYRSKLIEFINKDKKLIRWVQSIQ